MPQITFRKIDDEEAIIFHDGEAVGDLYRHEDPITGKPVYLVSLIEDPRGWTKTNDRTRIRDIIRSQLATHPLMGWRWS